MNLHKLADEMVAAVGRLDRRLYPIAASDAADRSGTNDVRLGGSA
ncbi:MAG: hypothetical protein R6W94_01365 [Spirochaetia bacterium]